MSSRYVPAKRTIYPQKFIIMQTTSETSIPSKISSFNVFIRKTDTLLQAGDPKRYIQLGISESAATAWHTFNTQWVNLYDKYIDPYNTRTPAVTDGLYAVIEGARTFEIENRMIVRISISENATAADFEAFNINTRNLRPTRSIPQSPIEELVEVKLTPIGGGSVSIKCYGSGQRAAIISPADSVQYRYTIGAIAPTSADDDNLEMNISTKGAFMLQGGVACEGKRLYIYFRWYNTKHPDIAGPWSQLQTTIVL